MQWNVRCHSPLSEVVKHDDRNCDKEEIFTHRIAGLGQFSRGEIEYLEPSLHDHAYVRRNTLAEGIMPSRVPRRWLRFRPAQRCTARTRLDTFCLGPRGLNSSSNAHTSR